MSDPVAQYVVKVRDDASSVLANVSSSVTDLRDVMSTLATKAGPVGAISVAMAGLAAAAAASAIALADDVEQMDRLSTQTGVSADKLQAMQRVIREGGGDPNSLPAALSKLNQAVQNGDPLVKRLGLSTTDTFTAFRQLSDMIRATSDVKVRDHLATQLLGRSAAEMIPDLISLSASFDGTYEAMARVGALMDDETIASTTKFNNQVDQLKSSWEDFTTSIGKKTLPVLANLAAALADATRQAFGFQKTQKQLADEAVAEMVAERQGLSQEDLRKSLVSQRQLRVDMLVRNPGDTYGLRMIEAFNRAIAEIDNKAELARRAAAAAAGAPKNVLPSRNNPEDLGGLPSRSLTKDSLGVQEDSLRELIAVASDAASGLKNDYDALVETTQRLSLSAQLLTESFEMARSQMAADTKSIANDVIAGTLEINAAWQRLIQSILSNMAESAVDFGVDLLFSFIPVPGAGAVGDKVGKLSATSMSGGGNTFNISTLDAKSVVQELASPSGSLRRANDYVRNVSRASSR